MRGGHRIHGALPQQLAEPGVAQFARRFLKRQFARLCRSGCVAAFRKKSQTVGRGQGFDELLVGVRFRPADAMMEMQH